MTAEFRATRELLSMDEGRIKAAILAQVRRAAGRRAKPTVAPEFPLPKSGVRADLAILAEDFIGVEIKSASDTLRRLRGQLDAYATYFDRVVLVVADKHIRGIDSAWLKGAALWRLTGAGQIEEVIPAGTGPAKDPMVLLDLLPQQERRRFFGTQAGASPETPRAYFAEAFRARYGRTSAAFWDQVRGRGIREEDLASLSRFAELRTLHRKHAENRDEFWRRWAEASVDLED